MFNSNPTRTLQTIHKANLCVTLNSVSHHPTSDRSTGSQAQLTTCLPFAGLTSPSLHQLANYPSTPILKGSPFSSALKTATRILESVQRYLCTSHLYQVRTSFISVLV